MTVPTKFGDTSLPLNITLILLLQKLTHKMEYTATVNSNTHSRRRTSCPLDQLSADRRSVVQSPSNHVTASKWHTVKLLMLACLLFREFGEPNKTAKLIGANINCRPNKTKLLQYIELYGFNSPK